MIRRFAVVAMALVVLSARADEPGDLARQLGDRKYDVRERATQRLWQLGRTAERALERAATSSDAETAQRARGLLEKFQWGLYPDTPDNIAELIQSYRSGDEDVRRQVVDELMRLGKPGYVALRCFAIKATDAGSKAVLGSAMTTAAQTVVPTLLLTDDFDTAESVLEACLIAGQSDAVANYAAFHALRNTLPAAIERWRRDPADARATEVLVGLYQANGDLAAARRVAEAGKLDERLDILLWRHSDWPTLASRPIPARIVNSSGLHAEGLLALYRQLAGQRDEAERVLAGIRKTGSDPADEEQRFIAAHALLFNERPADALALLTQPYSRPMRFDLLATHGRYAEAFALAVQPVPDDLKDSSIPGEMAARHGRVRLVLGDRERGLEVLRTAAANCRAPRDGDTLAELVKACTRGNAKGEGRALASTYLDLLPTLAVADRLDPTQRVLDAAFPLHGDAARIWWRVFAAKLPKESAAARLDRIASLVEAPAPGQTAPGPSRFATDMLAASDTEVRANKVSPAMAFAALARAAEVAGLAGEQEVWLRRGAKELPGTGGIRLGDYLRERGRFAEAAAAYRAAFEGTGRDEPLPLYLAGLMFEQHGQRDEGRRLQSHARWLPLGNTHQRSQCADGLASRGYLEAALAERELALKLIGTDERALASLLHGSSRASAMAGDFARAAELATQAWVGWQRSGASFSEASTYLLVPALARQHEARAALAAGRLDDARRAIRQASALQPASLELAILVVPPLAERGHTADADAQYDNVTGRYRDLLREYPQSGHLHNSLAWVAACCHRDLDRGLEHAQQAVRLAPGYAGYLDTLAEVLFQRGDTAGAIATMERCRALEPGHRYFNQQLARFRAGDARRPPPPESDDD